MAVSRPLLKSKVRQHTLIKQFDLRWPSLGVAIFTLQVRYTYVMQVTPTTSSRDSMGSGSVCLSLGQLYCGSRELQVETTTPIYTLSSDRHVYHPSKNRGDHSNHLIHGLDQQVFLTWHFSVTTTCRLKCFFIDLSLLDRASSW